MKKKLLHIEIQKADGMQGFAAYISSPARSKKRIVLLNVYATLLSAVEEEKNKKDVIESIRDQMITHLMHEFGHIMENYFNREFNEEFIEEAIKSYSKKYNKKSYIDIHGEQDI